MGEHICRAAEITFRFEDVLEELQAAGTVPASPRNADEAGDAVAAVLRLLELDGLEDGTAVGCAVCLEESNHWWLMAWPWDD